MAVLPGVGDELDDEAPPFAVEIPCKRCWCLGIPRKAPESVTLDFTIPSHQAESAVDRRQLRASP